MKKFFLITLLLVGLIGLAQIKTNPAVQPKQKPTPATEDYVVHEWGTFTTLHGSDGQMVGGLHIEEENLPDFVYEHNYDPKEMRRQRQASYGSKAGPVSRRNRNITTTGIQLANVTVKMETPVIYFYSDKAREVDVKVKFPRGSISQWYPQRSDGEMMKSGKTYDFEKAFNGWIHWDTEVLHPDAKPSYTPDQSEVTNTWQAPRETKANLVRSNGETEKYLFYRGMANFSIPVGIEFSSFSDLHLTNTGDDAIPYVFVYESDGLSSKLWKSGGLEAGKEMLVNLSGDARTDKDEMFKEFEDALVAAGLYRDEAKAMLKTWEHSYFQKPGLKAFWIVPEAEVDRLLPLQISPAPKEVKRVFVGRCDIMTPEQEQALMEYKGHKHYNDRYSLGYNERRTTLQQSYLQNLANQ